MDAHKFLRASIVREEPIGLREAKHEVDGMLQRPSGLNGAEHDYLLRVSESLEGLLCLVAGQTPAASARPNEGEVNPLPAPSSLASKRKELRRQEQQDYLPGQARTGGQSMQGAALQDQDQPEGRKKKSAKGLDQREEQEQPAVSAPARAQHTEGSADGANKVG